MMAPTLPVELWDSIFKLATEIPGEYDVEDSIWYEPEGYFKREVAHTYASNWIRSLRTRYRIVLVCRSWNALATRYLYGSFFFGDWPELTVGFSRMLSILTRLCENNPHLFGYVKRITLGTRIAFSSQLSGIADPILNLCHNLIKLELSTAYHGESTKFPASLQSLIFILQRETDQVRWFPETLASIKSIPYLALHDRSLALRRVFKPHSTRSKARAPPFSIVAFNLLTDHVSHPPFGLVSSITHLHISSKALLSTSRRPANLPELRSLSLECNIKDDPWSLYFHDMLPSLDSLSSLQLIFDSEDGLCPKYTSSPLRHSNLPKLNKIFLTSHNLTSTASLRWLVSWMQDEALDVEWYATDIGQSGDHWIGKEDCIDLVSRKLVT